jgi:hypothetical protein
MFGLVLALLLLAAPGARAQISGGNIYGTVTDASGGILPGADVTLAALTIGGAPRSTTTDNAGGFRFLNLDNDTYKLTVTLPGFTTVDRDVIVNTGMNVNVAFTLTVATVQETLTVTAESPVVDTKKLGTSTTLTSDELLAVPNGRDPWVVLQTVPGVLVDRVNIAGNESGQQSNFSGKGAATGDSMWTLDGVVITDVVSSGASSSYFDYEAFDEIAVTTGGTDLRVQTSGVGLNFVTKRGTNQHRGTGRLFLAHENLQSSNLPDELAGDERLLLEDGTFSENADHIERNLDGGFDIGGPVLRDRLWYWFSYGYTDLRIRRLTQTPDRTVLKNYNAKVNWQAGENDMFSFFWFNGAKEKYGRSPGQANDEPESFLWDQGNFYPEDTFLSPLHGLWKFEDNHVFSSTWLLNAKYAWYGWGYGFRPLGGFDQQGGVDQINSVAYGAWNGFTARKPWHIVDVNSNYFAGNHELKFGFGYRHNPNKTSTTWTGNQVVGFKQPGGNIAWVTRQRNVAFEGNYTNLFVSDTYVKDRLTLNVGLRWDRQTAENGASSVAANPAFPDILPALSYPGGGPTIDWNNWSPRLGLTYAVTEDSKTVARVSYAKYAGQLNPFEITSISPVGGYYTFVAYDWNDLNNDNFAQANEVNVNAPPLYANAVDPANPSALEAINQLDPDYRANTDHEFIAGLDHELFPNVALSLAYTHKQGYDITSWNPRVGFTPADYFPTGPPESQNGYTAQTFSPDPDKLAASQGARILTNRPDYHRAYDGLELTVTRRLVNRWMARAGFGWNNWREYIDGPNAAGNPTRTDSYSRATSGLHDTSGPLVDGGQIAPRSYGAKSNIFFNAKWQMNANGLYQLPYDIDLAGNLFVRQGYPMPIVLILPAGGDGSGLRALGTSEIDEVRYDTMWNLDIRLAKRIQFGGGRNLELIGDLFNLLNNDIVLERNRIANGDNFNDINEVISPRILRFGIRVTF